MASPGTLGGIARRCTAAIARRGGAGLKVNMRPAPAQKVSRATAVQALAVTLVVAKEVAHSQRA